MPVEAGESTVANPPQQIVDAQALANAIVQNVMATLPVQQPGESVAAARRERVSVFRSKADELLKSGQVDEASLPIMLQLVEAMGEDLTAKQQEEYLKAAQQQQTQAIHAELGRMIERYAQTAESPELIRELKLSISKRTIDEYNANPVLVNKYRNNGEVDWNEMDKIVVKHVSRWSKTGAEGGGKEKPSGGPAMKNDAPSGAIEPSREISKDALNERQLDKFNADVSFAIKNMNMKREDAEKRALTLINNAESKLRAKR